MSTLFWILATLALIALASIVTVVLVVRAVYRRIRRSRAVNGAVLRNRARFSWGAQRRVLALRVQLADSLDSGQAAVDLAVRREGRRGELPRLFARIRNEGLILDDQLRLLESETDAAVLGHEIPAASLRVEQVADMVRRLRSAVASGLGDLTADTLVALRSEVDREVTALHAGVQELHHLNGHDRHADLSRQPSSDHQWTQGA
jgi:hypothetical protein